MRRLSIRFGVLATVLLATMGCNKPKDSCEGTMDSYAGCINANDPDCIVELMHPSERAKYGDKKIRAMFQYNWVGVHSYKWTYMQADTVAAGDLCVARTIAAWTLKIRGKKAEDVTNFGDVFTLHPVDGLWYIDVPGSIKVPGY